MKHLALFLSSIVVTASAFAQGPAASTVDVLGKTITPPPATLQQACPQALAELPDALAATAQDVATASVVSVRFEIEGGRISALQTQGGAGTQARAVRRAVRNLGCSNGDAGRQLVRFQVRFIDPFDRAQRQQVAVVDGAANQP